MDINKFSLQPHAGHRHGNSYEQHGWSKSRINMLMQMEISYVHNMLLLLHTEGF